MWRQVNWFQVTKGAFLGNILVTIRVRLRDEIKFVIKYHFNGGEEGEGETLIMLRYMLSSSIHKSHYVLHLS